MALQSLPAKEALLPPVQVEELYLEKVALSEYTIALSHQSASEAVKAKLSEIDELIQWRIGEEEKRRRRIKKKRMLLLN